MGKFIVVAQEQGLSNSVYIDTGAVIDINIDMILGDFFELVNASGAQREQILLAHIFTKIDMRLGENLSEFSDEVDRGLSLLDDFSKMVQQNEENENDIFTSILKAHGVELNYRFANLNNEEALHNVPFKRIRKHLDGDFRLTYSCGEISQMISAVFHYYIARKYHFVKCLHCGKHYANHHKKILYCGRISPYVDKHSQKADSTPKTCADAVKAARKQLRRRVARIYHKIESKPKYQTQDDKALLDLFNEFSKAAKNYLDLMERESSIQLLTDFNDYLEKIETMGVLKE